MHGIWNPENVKPRRLAPGVNTKIVSGENLMFSLVTLEPNAVVPEHAHPQEQMGMLMEGAMELTIAGERHILSGNALYLVAGGVPHKAVAGPKGAVVLDAFAPPREEYK